MKKPLSILSGGLLGAWVLGAAFGSPLSAQTNEPDPAPPGYRLGSPIIVKADWQSSNLRVVDINGDGRLDMVAVNNAKNLLQIFIGKEAAPDGTFLFEKKEIVLEQSVSNLAVGDFNDDKRMDLALAPSGEKVEIRLQNEEGELEPGLKLDSVGVILEAADFNKDGHVDLLVVSQNRTEIFYGPLPRPTTDDPKAAKDDFVNAATPGAVPLVADFTGNGFLDIAYLDGQNRGRVMLRAQRAAREWELETRIEIGEAGDLTALRRFPAGQLPVAGPAALATVDLKTQALRTYTLSEQAPDAGSTVRLNGPFFLSFDTRTMMGRDLAAVADLEGLGRQSLVVASGKGAEMTLFVQNAGGLLETRNVPALGDIAFLAVVPGKSGDIVFSLSPTEETIGGAAFSEDRGLTVPELKDARYKPLVMAAGDLDGSGRADLVYLYRNAESKLVLSAHLNPDDPKTLRAAPDLDIVLPLGDEVEPTDMIVADINGDKKGDLLIFQRYNPLVLLMREADGSFKPFSTEQGMRRGVFFKTTPATLVVEDLNQDGSNEILIARENLARAYRIDSDGEIRLLEQFNGKTPTSRIDSIAVADLNRSGFPEVVLLDSVNQVLTVYSRDADGNFTLAGHQETRGMRATRLLPFDANGDGRKDLLVYEEGRLQIFYSEGARRVFTPEWRRAPAEKDWLHSRVFSLPLAPRANSSGEQLIALVGKENVLEFYDSEGDETARLELFFRFKVFDDETSVGAGRPGARPEPRELLAADMNGDGLPDLVALMHDNIVIYPRQSDSKSETSIQSRPAAR
jgi:hypothetical protein